MLLPNWDVPACLLLNPGPECIASNSGNANKKSDGATFKIFPPMKNILPCRLLLRPGTQARLSGMPQHRLVHEHARAADVASYGVPALNFKH